MDLKQIIWNLHIQGKSKIQLMLLLQFKKWVQFQCLDSYEEPKGRLMHQLMLRKLRLLIREPQPIFQHRLKGRTTMRIEGPPRPEWQLNVSGLHEVKIFGGIYTWIGNRSVGTIKSKLDRVVATTEWKDKFPKAMVQLLDWVGSDHKPLLLHIDDNKWKGMGLFAMIITREVIGRYIRFSKMLGPKNATCCLHSNFMKLLRDAGIVFLPGNQSTIATLIEKFSSFIRPSSKRIILLLLISVILLI
ncbi:unnamed protein product [Arabidopsis halleri]